MKTRPVAILATALVVAAAFPAAAPAQNAHLKGRNPELFVDNGLTLTSTLVYAGLGNFDTLQRVDATGNPSAICANNGQHAAPGQNPAEANVSGETAVPAGDIKNGNV